MRVFTGGEGAAVGAFGGFFGQEVSNFVASDAHMGFLPLEGCGPEVACHGQGAQMVVAGRVELLPPSLQAEGVVFHDRRLAIRLDVDGGAICGGCHCSDDAGEFRVVGVGAHGGEGPQYSAREAVLGWGMGEVV